MPPVPPLPPHIDCLSMPRFAADDVETVRAAFRSATPIPLRQAWRHATEQDFSPGLVRTGWRDNSLLVFAELTDADIFTHAQRHNDRFWELGDTFELFLQQAGAEGYVELHVSPNNLRLQLRFAAPPSPGSGPGVDPFETALIRDDVFTSTTWVDHHAHEWCVFAEVPAGVVAGVSAPLAGSDWRFSFSRYDYTRGRTQPVISSSSPHAEPAFHRPHEWGTLTFRVAAGI